MARTSIAHSAGVAGGGRPRRVDMWEVLGGIFYVLENGGSWDALPHDLSSGKTSWFYFNRFSRDGTWERIARGMYPAARARAERDPEPSAAVIDA